MGHFVGTYQALIRTAEENGTKVLENPALAWGLLQRFCQVGHPYSEIRQAPKFVLVGHESEMTTRVEDDQCLVIEQSWGGLDYLLFEALQENVFTAKEDAQWPKYEPAEVEEVSGWFCLQTREDVNRFLKATEELTEEKLRPYFHPGLMNRDDVYPMNWYDSDDDLKCTKECCANEGYDEESDFSVAVEDYRNVRQFFAKADQENQIVLHFGFDVY